MTQARENIIISVIQQTGRSREQVAPEVDRQLAESCDGHAGETIEEVVGVLAFYCSTGLYDQVREQEAARLGIRVETLDGLVAAERVRQGSGIAGSARREAIFQLAAKLYRSIEPNDARELIEAWNSTFCLPPLLPAEMSRALDAAAKVELRRRRSAA
jgi:hypothetical protein